MGKSYWDILGEYYILLLYKIALAREVPRGILTAAMKHTLLTVSLIMGVFFIYVGAWVILPFSLLELSVLLACMYYCLRRAQRQEVIRVTAEHVTIERGRREPEATKQYMASSSI